MHVRMVLAQVLPGPPAAERVLVELVGIGLDGADDDVGSLLSQPDLGGQPVRGHPGVGIGHGHPVQLVRTGSPRRVRALITPAFRARPALPSRTCTLRVPGWRAITAAESSVQESSAMTTSTGTLPEVAAYTAIAAPRSR